MTAHNLNWTGSMSLERGRPVAVQSPLSSSYLTNIKGRLSFSASKSPSLPKRFSLGDRNNMSRVNGSHFSHLGDYHMSKQNPDVLDQMSPAAVAKREHSLHKKHLAPSEITRYSPGPSIVLANRNGHTPLQSSLLRQISNGHTPPSSLVHLATRGSGMLQQRLNGGISRSPVTVRLSGGTTGLTNSHNDHVRKGVVAVSHDMSGDQSSNPCDKNVVLSALRQKRKRWATSAPDDFESTWNGLPGEVPQAKRSRHSTTQSSSRDSPASGQAAQATAGRKRSQTTPSLPAFKRSKVTNDVVNKLTNKIVVPEIECESEGEEGSAVTAETGSQGSAATDGWSIESVTGSDPLCRRSMTPPTPLDEMEMSKKREESLSALKAVFPATNQEDGKPSLRRKLPIFCATGAKPHLPTPLSVTHSATQEDLKKDRAATAAKLKQILAPEEEEKTLASPPPPSLSQTAASTASSTSVPAGGVKLSTSLAGGPTTLNRSVSKSLGSLSSITQAASQTGLASLQTGLTSIGVSSATTQVQQPTKSVSFAPLPATPLSSTSSGQSPTPSLTLPAPQTLTTDNSKKPLAPSLQLTATAPASSTAPSNPLVGLKLGVPSTSVAGGLSLGTLQPSASSSSWGLSLGALQQPPPPATTTASGGLALSNLPALSTGGLSLSALQTQSTSTAGGVALGSLQGQPKSIAGGITLSGLQAQSLSSTGGLSFPSQQAPAPSTQTGLNIGSVTTATASAASQSTQQPGAGFSLSSNLQLGSGGSLFGGGAPNLTTTQPQQQQTGGLFAASKPSPSVGPSAQQPSSLSLNLLSNPNPPVSNSGLSFPQQTSSNNTAKSNETHKPANQFAFNLSNATNVYGGGSSLTGSGAMNSQQQQQPSSGLMFPNQTSSIFGQPQPQQTQTATNGGSTGGISFNLSGGTTNSGSQATASNSGFNFSAGAGGGVTPSLSTQTTGTGAAGLSLFNSSAQKTQQQQSNVPSFNFTAAAPQQQQAKSNGQPLFGGGQSSTGASSSNGFTFSLNTNQPQQKTQLNGGGGIFGSNTGSMQQQQGQTQNGISFSAGGMGTGQSMFPSGQQQQQTSGLNLGGGGQNQNTSSGFNFSTGSASSVFGQGSSNPQTGGSGFNFSGAGLNLGNTPQQAQNNAPSTGSNVFSFGTPQQQTPRAGFSFQTPTNQQQQQQGTPGINFQATPSNLNFSVGSTPRQVAKPRRRRK